MEPATHIGNLVHTLVSLPRVPRIDVVDLSIKRSASTDLCSNSTARVIDTKRVGLLAKSLAGSLWLAC